MSRRRWVPRAIIEQMLAAVGAAERRRSAAWLAERFGVLPYYWGRHIAAEHARRGGIDAPAANRWLLDVTDEAGGALPFGATDDDIRQAAHTAAREMLDLSGRGDHMQAYYRCAAIARRRYGVDAPAIRNDDVLPALRRLLCPQWWLRRLRRAAARRCEGAAIRASLVRRGLWPYVSQDQLARREAQVKRNAAAVDGAAIVDLDSAEAVDLRAVVDGSVASPAIRRAEMMTRIKGADVMASLNGHAVEFWTITCPSKYHAQKTGRAVSEVNPAYAGKTPRDGQVYICSVWARARAAWARRGLHVYGLRTAEPHHDGTPHWHIVVYGLARDVRYARRLLRVYALREDGGEPGARKHRFTAMALKGGKAGASYAAKYIAKNIDGGCMDGQRDGETGRDVGKMARRVTAWAAAWGIRQFQFFGMQAVTLWRVLRRCDNSAPAGSALERARAAADAGDWAGYCAAAAAGGLRALYDRGVLAVKRLTQYGDSAAPRVIGVAEGGRQLCVTVRRWVVCWSASAKKQAVERASAPGVEWRAALAGVSGLPLVLCQ